MQAAAGDAGSGALVARVNELEASKEHEGEALRAKFEAEAEAAAASRRMLAAAEQAAEKAKAATAAAERRAAEAERAAGTQASNLAELQTQVAATTEVSACACIEPKWLPRTRARWQKPSYRGGVTGATRGAQAERRPLRDGGCWLRRGDTAS